MDYCDAINEILDKAGTIKLPQHRLDVVTVARREFGNAGTVIPNSSTPLRERSGTVCEVGRWSKNGKSG